MLQTVPSFYCPEVTVVRKIGLAILLMTLTGVSSATGNGGSNGGCPSNMHPQQIWFIPITFCVPNRSPSTVQAPEIDPASAMAGLTMLAGGLAVLRGRRLKPKK
jgi:hypothetical protein